MVLVNAVFLSRVNILLLLFLIALNISNSDSCEAFMKLFFLAFSKLFTNLFLYASPLVSLIAFFLKVWLVILSRSC